MANIKLKNQYGNPIIYNNVDTITLKDENDEDIIFSTGVQLPKLNAPTITLILSNDGTKDQLKITNPASNGNFITGYNIYLNSGSGYQNIATVEAKGQKTLNISEYSLPAKDYSIKVTAIGTNFLESDYSNELNYTNVFYTVKNTLTNCTSNNSTTSIRKGSAYSATITADSDYVLKKTDAKITMKGKNISATAYSDSVITINSVAGNIVITISATELNGEQ